MSWGSEPLPTHSHHPAQQHLPRHSYELAGIIEADHPSLSIARQVELLGVHRQTYYYRPTENETTQALLKRDMDAIDAIYTDYPFYGSRRMHDELWDRYEIDIGRARIRTVMQLRDWRHSTPNPTQAGLGLVRATPSTHTCFVA